MDWKRHIVSDADVLHGQPRIQGTRIPVSVVLDNLSAGQSVDDLQTSYPALTREAVLAAIAYAADLARERVMALPAA